MNEDLYEEIKRRILHLEYQPGELLPMRKLAKSLGVSTTPVRETLVRLTNEKLVEWAPNSTARVAQVSFKELRDVFELRLLLEEYCDARGQANPARGARTLRTVARAAGR
jgi:DNA-binding GntR family transcriptional regulator